MLLNYTHTDKVLKCFQCNAWRGSTKLLNQRVELSGRGKVMWPMTHLTVPSRHQKDMRINTARCQRLTLNCRVPIDLLADTVNQKNLCQISQKHARSEFLWSCWSWKYAKCSAITHNIPEQPNPQCLQWLVFNMLWKEQKEQKEYI